MWAWLATFFGGSALIKSAMCSIADALAKYNKAKTDHDALIKQVTTANAAGKGDQGLTDRASTFVNRMAEITTFRQTKVIDTDFWSSDACQLNTLVSALQNDEAALSAEIGKRMGQAPVVLAPPSEFDWMKYALIAGGLFAAYKLFGEHGGEIPKSQLPRYAGGTRRASRSRR